MTAEIEDETTPGSSLECDNCGRAIAHPGIVLYGEALEPGDDPGVLRWQAGPFGAGCASNIAADRWDAGLMTYRTYDTNGPANPYTFPGREFGGARPTAGR